MAKAAVGTRSRASGKPTANDVRLRLGRIAYRHIDYMANNPGQAAATKKAGIAEMRTYVNANTDWTKRYGAAWVNAFMGGIWRAQAGKYKGDHPSIPENIGEGAAKIGEAVMTVPHFLGKLPTYFQIGAGGLGLIITGLALVYVAGRRTPVPAAGREIRRAALRVASPAGGAIRVASRGARGAVAAPARVRSRISARAYDRTRNAERAAASDRTSPSIAKGTPTIPGYSRRKGLEE